MVAAVNIILLWIIYRFWWRQKKCSCSFGEAQDDLDNAIEGYNQRFEYQPVCAMEPYSSTPIIWDHEQIFKFGKLKIARKKSDDGDADTIGLSFGAAKDSDNFRKCIQENVMPSIDSITYNGIFCNYYFDTWTRKHVINYEHKMDEDRSLY